MCSLESNYSLKIMQISYKQIEELPVIILGKVAELRAKFLNNGKNE